MVRKVLIKVSGNLIDDPKTTEFIEEQSRSAFVVVLVGGGESISIALEVGNYESHWISVGRVIPDFEGRQLARDVLEKNQQKIQDKLVKLGINAVVETPVINLGGVLCHLNGDNMASACSINFDRTFILTRRKEKEVEGHNIEIVVIE